MKGISTPSAQIEIILEPNAFNQTAEEKTHVVPIMLTAPPSTQPARRIARSMSSGDDSIKSNVYFRFD